MITLEFIYVLMGILTGGVAIVNLLDGSNPRRYANTFFWGLYATTFLFGSYLPDLASGIIVILMVLVATRGLGQSRRDTSEAAEREASARRWRNLLFVPALTVPAVTLAGTIFLK